MRVCQLKLKGFRNYAALDLAPGAGLNILYGANAQGKSNVLEALSLLATTRSLRAGRESELIRRDSDMAHVQADIEREREGEAELLVSIFQTDKKAVRVNGVKKSRVVDLLGQFNAVFFGALDLAIVSGEPSDRRHYLNVEISQISPRYVYDLGHYKRTLEQRNRLLRDLRDRPARYRAESGLDAWNEQLVQYGAPLFEKRRFYIARLAPIANAVHRDLTDGAESLEIRYLPSIALPEEGESGRAGEREKRRKGEGETRDTNHIHETSEERYLADAKQQTENDGGDGNGASSRITPNSALTTPTQNGPQRPLTAPDSVAQAFRDQLCRVADDEARRGTTLIGPQRDDLCFSINGADARIYGSQGQQRTVALALKLAEFQLIEDWVGEPPVMLLDDVMSDLDDTRRGHLLQWLNRRCQTFLTCTNLRSFPDSILRDATIFRVVAGTVTAEGPEVRSQGPGAEPTNDAAPSALSTFGADAGETESDGETASGREESHAEPERSVPETGEQPAPEMDAPSADKPDGSEPGANRHAGAEPERQADAANFRNDASDDANNADEPRTDSADSERFAGEPESLAPAA